MSDVVLKIRRPTMAKLQHTLFPYATLFRSVKKSSLTFAPEAGSQRLRDVINKGLTEEIILKGSALAFEGGWTRVKLYFMLGLPTETEEDIRGIAELSNKIAATFFEIVPKEARKNGKVQIVTSTSFFIPKPFTPFQWAPQCTKEEFLEKAYKTKRAIMDQLNQKRSEEHPSELQSHSETSNSVSFLKQQNPKH